MGRDDACDAAVWRLSASATKWVTSQNEAYHIQKRKLQYTNKRPIVSSIETDRIHKREPYWSHVCDAVVLRRLQGASLCFVVEAIDRYIDR